LYLETGTTILLLEDGSDVLFLAESRDLLTLEDDTVLYQEESTPFLLESVGQDWYSLLTVTPTTTTAVSGQAASASGTAANAGIRLTTLPTPADAIGFDYSTLETEGGDSLVAEGGDTLIAEIALATASTAVATSSITATSSGTSSFGEASIGALAPAAAATGTALSAAAGLRASAGTATAGTEPLVFAEVYDLGVRNGNGFGFGYNATCSIDFSNGTATATAIASATFTGVDTDLVTATATSSAFDQTATTAPVPEVCFITASALDNGSTIALTVLGVAEADGSISGGDVATSAAAFAGVAQATSSVEYPRVRILVPPSGVVWKGNPYVPSKTTFSVWSGREWVTSTALGWEKPDEVLAGPPEL
jgi:hypothetical protein